MGGDSEGYLDKLPLEKIIGDLQRRITTPICKWRTKTHVIN
jgi:hypothetical protein